MCSLGGTPMALGVLGFQGVNTQNVVCGKCTQAVGFVPNVLVEIPKWKMIFYSLDVLGETLMD